MLSLFTGLFSSLFKALSSFFTWKQEGRLVQAGQDKEVAKSAQKEVEVILASTKARDEARSANASVPVANSLPDDGFRRD